MDADELLRSDAPLRRRYLSLVARRDAPNDLGSLLQHAVLDERFWITPIVRMEILYSARTSAEYAQLELDALRLLRNDRAVADAAASALRELAERADGYHRVLPTDASRHTAQLQHYGETSLGACAHNNPYIA